MVLVVVRAANTAQRGVGDIALMGLNSPAPAGYSRLMQTVTGEGAEFLMPGNRREDGHLATQTMEFLLPRSGPKHEICLDPETQRAHPITDVRVINLSCERVPEGWEVLWRTVGGSNGSLDGLAAKTRASAAPSMYVCYTRTAGTAAGSEGAGPKLSGKELASRRMNRSTTAALTGLTVVVGKETGAVPQGWNVSQTKSGGTRFGLHLAYSRNEDIGVPILDIALVWGRGYLALGAPEAGNMDAVPPGFEVIRTTITGAVGNLSQDLKKPLFLCIKRRPGVTCIALEADS